MSFTSISELLRALDCPDPEAAWEAFLCQYSPLLQQIIVLSVDDAESQADCFVYACEQLAKSRFRRLRRFDISGDASFATWLRAVVRNLCIDWHRRNRGRYQPFEWTTGLDALDRQVFRCLYEQGYSVGECFEFLSAAVPGLTPAAVEESAERLGKRLSSRERWLLSTRKVQLESLDAGEEQGRSPFRVPDLAPDPERAAIDREYQESLSAAMQGLPVADQLLIRLRFEQDLTLAEIARLTGLKDAQAVDRRLRNVIELLRGRMAGFSPQFRGKTKPASV